MMESTFTALAVVCGSVRQCYATSGNGEQADTGHGGKGARKRRARLIKIKNLVIFGGRIYVESMFRACDEGSVETNGEGLVCAHDEAAEL